jgi:hypothetical protein
VSSRPPAPDAPPTGTGSAAGLPSPLDAVPDMRATAKWVLGAAAAVGAALVGGAPLAAVGKVHGAGHAALAYLGLAIGLAGVGWAIWRTADALIPPLTTPLSLDTEPNLADLRRKIKKDPRAFFGPFGTNMAQLQQQYEFHHRVARVLRDTLATEPDAARRKVIRAQLREAQAAVSSAQLRIRALLELSHAWQVRAQLRDARLQALLGAAVAAAGAVLFLVSTS